MTISNINCNYIGIESEEISNFLTNPANYTSVEIKGKLNCCDEEFTSLLDETTISERNWTLAFPNGEGTITELVVENYVSGEQFNILNSTYDLTDYVCSTGTVSNFFPIVQQWFTDNFNTTVTQSYNYDVTTLECDYLIEDLPPSIRPVKIVIDRNGLQEEVFFSYVASTNFYIAGSQFVIEPSFFGLQEFVDGVYGFELVFNTTLGATVVESSCFFYDCETKCKVSKKLEDLLKCNKSATNIFLLHYTLTEGNNCGCNCEEMCEIFIKLCEKLGDDKTCTACGC